MTKQIQQNYSALDQPEVLRCLFHPRPESGYRRSDTGREDLMIPVGEGVAIAASCHHENTENPVVLFFHGNGEIVSDYDDLGRFYTDLGINLFVLDYRGYGSSTGSPTVTSMMTDCHLVLDYLLAYRTENQMKGPVCLMGRSLGSASAIELAAARSQDVSCLIIESGFAFSGPLLRVLGIDPDRIGYTENQGFENIDKIKRFLKPCLIIHAQYDHIIPFSDGRALYDSVGSKDKFFLEIKDADHNDLFFKGMSAYLDHIQKICFFRSGPDQS